MFRVAPTAHASPPTGAVSASEPLTVKAAESVKVRVKHATDATVSADSAAFTVKVRVKHATDATVSADSAAVSASEPLTVKAAESAETVASVACFTLTLTVLPMASPTVQE